MQINGYLRTIVEIAYVDNTKEPDFLFFHLSFNFFCFV